MSTRKLWRRLQKKATLENCRNHCTLPARALVYVFRLNGFLNFIHQPPPTNPLALQFFIAISATHFSAFFFAVQLVAGLLLLSGYFVPLALVLLAAEIFDILAFHLTMAPATIGPGLLAALLWILVFLQYRRSFDEILRAKPMGLHVFRHSSTCGKSHQLTPTKSMAGS